MPVTTKPLLTLTAGDLMTAEVISLPGDMSLRDAAGLILKHQVSGAPVVDAGGKCIGVLSAIDFLRRAVTPALEAGSLAPRLPVTCDYQAQGRGPEGEQYTLCTLPPGVCPIQVTVKAGPAGGEVVTCGQPHSVLVDWQVVKLEKVPNEPVRKFMTPDPVTVAADTPIRVLARLMVDAHIHRVVVTNKAGKPLGIVSSTDILAALAYAEAHE
jgi:CBS domain-containing protein